MPSREDNINKLKETTVSQVLDMTEKELGLLAKHMRHDVKTHREFYRISHSTLELSKVAKLLCFVEQDKENTWKDKPLSEISLTELPDVEESDEEEETKTNWRKRRNSRDLSDDEESSEEELMKSNQKKRKKIRDLPDNEDSCEEGEMETNQWKRKNTRDFPDIEESSGEEEMETIQSKIIPEISTELETGEEQGV